MPAKSALASTTRPVDEKITINIGCVDLGQIDLLVQEGFYANRTDLIRTAIRNQLVAQVVDQVLGLLPREQVGQERLDQPLAAVGDGRGDVRCMYLATVSSATQ